MQDCFDYGGDWLKLEVTYDNLLQAVSHLFELSTSIGWREEMNQAEYS